MTEKNVTLLETDKTKIKTLYTDTDIHCCIDITCFQLEESAKQQSWCV